VEGGEEVTGTTRTRTVAAVLLVVFVLTTVWAAYYLYGQTHPTSSGTSPTVEATYTETGANSFVAALSPSYLYNNSTEIVGGNVTLFTPITNWINVSMQYVLLTSRSASISLTDTFTVTLSTPVWSKVLFTESNQTSNPDTSVASLATGYDVNVSSVVSLAKEIDAQIGYNGPAYTLTLSPVIAGSVGLGSATQSVSANPFMNFTVLGSLIQPSGLSYSGSGSVLLPSKGTSASPAAMVVPYAALIGSVGGLGGSIYYVARKPEEQVLLPLDQMIAPYEEAIAETRTPLGETSPIRVDEFTDLVKIADTLGKPILRPAGSESDRPEFFVLDGEVAYSYRYPEGPGAAGAPGPSTPAPGSLGPMVRTTRDGEVAARLKTELLRLKGRPLDLRTAAEVRARTRRAIAFLRAKDETAAGREVEGLSQYISRVLRRRPNSTSSEAPTS
jgi:hypothetical protein